MTRPPGSSRASGQPHEALKRDNVTLGAEPSGDTNYFPCPICRKLRLIEMSKKRKPYVTCNECGVQLFVRGKLGIRRLRRMLGEAPLSHDFQDTIGLLDYAAFLVKRRDELEETRPLFEFSVDRDRETQERFIRHELVRVRQAMEKAQGDRPEHPKKKSGAGR